MSIETNNHNNTLEDAEASFSIIQQSIEQPIEQQIEQQIVQPAAQSIKHTIEDTQQQTEEVIVQSIEQPIQLPIQVKKMRGRPPKSKQALVNDTPFEDVLTTKTTTFSPKLLRIRKK